MLPYMTEWRTMGANAFKPSWVEVRTYSGFGMRNVSVFWFGLCVFKVSLRTMGRRTQGTPQANGWRAVETIRQGDR